MPAPAERAAHVHVNAQHLGEKRGGVLAAAEGIGGGATVAKAEIKITVGTKSQFAALVIPKWLRHFKKNALGSHVRLVGVAGGHLKFADDAAVWKVQRLRMLVRAVFLVVINVKQAVGLEPGMKRDAQQAVFIVKIGMAVFDVQKLLRVTAVRAFFDDENSSSLVNDKKAA